MQKIGFMRSRSGWQPNEQQILWDEIEKASQSGKALRAAFDAVAQKTGRKPNSIRNFYYVSVKNGGAPNGVACQRALPFTPFDDQELHELVRQVLLGRAQGKSVRACVGELGGGDRQLALRYQNKYRSMLKTRPEYIRQVMAELAAQGVAFGDDFTPVRRRRAPAAPACADAVLSAALQLGPDGAALLEAQCDFLQSAAAICRERPARNTPDDQQAAGC